MVTRVVFAEGFKNHVLEVWTFLRHEYPRCFWSRAAQLVPTVSADRTEAAEMPTEMGVRCRSQATSFDQQQKRWPIGCLRQHGFQRSGPQIRIFTAAVADAQAGAAWSTSGQMQREEFAPGVRRGDSCAATPGN